NRVSGVKRATSRLNTYNNDEHANTTSEGIGSAIGNMVKSIATHTVARGLGVSSSGLHKFGHDLLNKPKAPAPTKKVVAPKHVQTKPARASWKFTHYVTPQDLHSAIAKYPGEHEHHLNAFINHHNKAIELKAKGDRTGATVHFRARNHALVRYQSTA